MPDPTQSPADSQDSHAKGDLHVRPYRPEDRQAVRDLCCDTGFLGKPIDPVFEDRELFADFLSSYYTDCEPECCFVLVMGSEVKGYLLGARKRFKLQLAGVLPAAWSGLRLLLRYPRYRPATRKYIHWLLTKGWRETPPAPKDAAHFHINILPEARTLDKTRELFNAFFDHLRACGETRVYGQMSTFETRRTDALFRRYGFTVLNRSEITKYRDFTSEPIYLTTCVRELQPQAGEDSYAIRSRRHGKSVARS